MLTVAWKNSSTAMSPLEPILRVLSQVVDEDVDRRDGHPAAEMSLSRAPDGNDAEDSSWDPFAGFLIFMLLTIVFSCCLRGLVATCCRRAVGDAASPTRRSSGRNNGTANDAESRARQEAQLKAFREEIQETTMTVRQEDLLVEETATSVRAMQVVNNNALSRAAEHPREDEDVELGKPHAKDHILQKSYSLPVESENCIIPNTSIQKASSLPQGEEQDEAILSSPPLEAISKSLARLLPPQTSLSKVDTETVAEEEDAPTTRTVASGTENPPTRLASAHSSRQEESVWVRLPAIRNKECLGAAAATANPENDDSSAPTIPSPAERSHGRYVSGTCAICLSCYQPQEQLTWSPMECCPHAFHTTCLLEYATTVVAHSTSKGEFSDISCPLCRQNFVKPYSCG